MDVFRLRDRLIEDYARYVESFVEIRDERIRARVESELRSGAFWPEPRVALNPAFEPGGSVDDLVQRGVLHPECAKIFRRKERDRDPHTNEERLTSEPLNLHRHQTEAILAAKSGEPYALTTGTGSGKSLAYIVPIVDCVLRQGSGRGIKAIVVYPMNALANSQLGELEKFLCYGYPEGHPPVTFRRYTGQEKQEEREAIIASPPDILLTNYVMLELILTRVWEKDLVAAAGGLRFLVLDELHTYRGRQGSDVAMLVRRVREASRSPHLQCVGTSATLATAGTFEEQREQVAAVASAIFGAAVDPSRVIGETLRRTTTRRDVEDPAFLTEMRAQIESEGRAPAHPGYDAFIRDPLSSWIESRLGLSEEPGRGRLVRTPPRPLTGRGGAAEELAAATGLDEDRCAAALRAQLLRGYQVRHPETGFPVFAFRLHQFIRRGDTAYVSLEAPAVRHVTLEARRFTPGDREHLLYPVVFCRECGQEYLRVHESGEVGDRSYLPTIQDELDPDQEANGYLYLSDANPWPEDEAEACERVPDDWVEERAAGPRVRSSRRKDLPRPLRLDGLGRERNGVQPAWFVPAPFRFCLSCGVAHSARTNEFAKLSTLAAGGRSSATTLLCLEGIRTLREDGSLPSSSRKILTFTDNRQDASLQAGHFNDFLQIGLLRAALHQAAVHAGAEGLAHEVLTQCVFDELDLPFAAYARDPEVKYGARKDTERALREMLGHRLYRDLERGWRLTSPNLEQCGLLEIRYEGLGELCADDPGWEGAHTALASASPEQRQRVCRTLLDHMRRELAIRVDYLDQRRLEAVRQLASQRLNATWGFDEEERPVHAKVMLPRSRQPDDYGGHLFLSPRSGFGQYLRRELRLPGQRLKLTDTEVIIDDLLKRLQPAGLVEVVETETARHQEPGYQLLAAGMRWLAADGSRAFHDPIRVPRQPDEGLRPNPYFVELFRRGVRYERNLEAREHTAQVPAAVRERREEQFRTAELPLLFCSPTMELGVDIKELNVVGMRNVPPTPANYAQRSGRAGRSGQPALVFTYCTTGSPHDQYFFARPQQMVSGQVAPPRLDLTNEDLLCSHVHSIWLAESGAALGRSLKDVLDVGGEQPSLEVLPSIRDALRDPAVRTRTLERSTQVLADREEELSGARWWHPGWLGDAVHAIEHEFDAACERWRSLYRSARAQRDLQDRIITDASRPAKDKEKAQRLRAQAEAQMQLLLSENDDTFQADFNSYRYLASEGFLPGYSFPRLPLSAFIPGSRARIGDEFLQRPRFLAISEFGPRNLLYHEGSRYEIDRVLLPVAEPGHGEGRAWLLRSAKRCGACGYLHPATQGDAGDRCDRCGAELDVPMEALFRLQNVSTRRRERINCDEEERRRYGYEVRTAIRFEEVKGRPSMVGAEILGEGSVLTRLAYGQAATVWRINLGWRKRAPGEDGFWLDLDSGKWMRRPASTEAEEPDDEELGPSLQRVVPYVEDHRNCLLMEGLEKLPVEVVASLQWALAAAMQAVFELEDGELASEPLPDERRRRAILFYEAAEGGAGALRRLVEEPGMLAAVARKALELCHFDPETGAERQPEGAAERCEAACYDCLLSYRNQRDHRLLDRALLPDLLRQLAAAEVRLSPVGLPREEHLAALMARTGSGLEREWLDWIERSGRNLPDEAQTLVERAGTKPDFLYRRDGVAVYVDGPAHDHPDRALRDRTQAEALQDLGWTVLRFGAEDDWERVAAGFPSILGGRR